MSEVTARPVILVTGLSGAGLSTALKVLEDIGYEAVDNLRLGLIPDLVDFPEANKPLAVAVDSRNAHFSADKFIEVLDTLRAREDIVAKLLFLECSDEALLHRFTATRRRHPLALDRPVLDGIEAERELMGRLHEAADHVIDTSVLTVHDLRRLIAGHYRLNKEAGLSVFVTSFSYREGVPREADMVFDVRFLDNPFWDPKLRPLDGRNPAVATYIQKDKDYQSFMDHLVGLLRPLLPRYQLEGKSYLTIAVGCTGGRHRSVFIAEQLATILAGSGYIVGIGHRDLTSKT